MSKSKVNLPPSGLRFGGQHFLDDANFINSSKEDIEFIQQYAEIDKTTNILDVGGGPGRFPIGLINHVGKINHFKGLDVDRQSVRWCKNNISVQYTNYSFEYIDVYNERYNSSGNVFLNDDFKFDIEDNSFDLIHLYSVFSHLQPNDVNIYLKEFKRLLKEDGIVFFTAFIKMDSEEDVIINPSDFGPCDWKGPLHCVLYDYDYFVTDILSGFEILDEKWFSGTDKQTKFIVKNNG